MSVSIIYGNDCRYTVMESPLNGTAFLKKYTVIHWAKKEDVKGDEKDVQYIALRVIKDILAHSVQEAIDESFGPVLGDLF